MTHNMEYKLRKNSLEKSLNKWMAAVLNQQKSAIPKEGNNLISKLTTLYYSKCLHLSNKLKSIKKIGKYVPFTYQEESDRNYH